MRVLTTILFLSFKYVFGDGDDVSENVVADSVRNVRGSTEDFFARAPRFLSFNKESNKLRVEASFAVPLLSIPVGGEPSTNLHGGNAALTIPKIDINLKSVVTVASIFLLVFIILPKLLRMNSLFCANQEYRSSGDSMLDDATKLLSETMERFDMDFESCTQKAACWTVNKVVTKMKEGKSSGPEKLLDAINSSLPYLKHLIGDTWLWSIVRPIMSFGDGENGNCDQYNQKCIITSKGISLAAGSLLASLKSTKL